MSKRNVFVVKHVVGAWQKTGNLLLPSSVLAKKLQCILHSIVNRSAKPAVGTAGLPIYLTQNLYYCSYSWTHCSVARL